MCWLFQNMNPHQAVSEVAQTIIVNNVVRKTSPLNNSPTPGPFPCLLFSFVHSSGSGTDFRIQNTSSAGTMPTKNTTRGQLSNPFKHQFAKHASKTPRFTPV